MLATWGQAKKRWESWLLWIAADLIYIPLYASRGLYLTSVLYAAFLIMSIYGLINFLRIYRAQQAAAPA